MSFRSIGHNFFNFFLGVKTAVPATIQNALDTAASYLDSTLTGRITLPITLAPFPLFLTNWVAVMGVNFLFGRRNDLPKNLKLQVQRCEEWLIDFRNRKVGIPGLSRAQPELVDSNYTDGRSQFDHFPYFDRRPTKTSTSKGK